MKPSTWIICPTFIIFSINYSLCFTQPPTISNNNAMISSWPTRLPLLNHPASRRSTVQNVKEGDQWEPNVNLQQDFDNLRRAHDELYREDRDIQDKMTRELDYLADSKRSIGTDLMLRWGFIWCIVNYICKETSVNVLSSFLSKMFVSTVVIPSLVFQIVAIVAYKKSVKSLRLSADTEKLLKNSKTKDLLLSSYQSGRIMNQYYDETLVETAPPFVYLTELATSALSSMYFMYIASLIITIFKVSGLKNFMGIASGYSMLSVLRLVTTLAVGASFHQFPSLIFELKEAAQKKGSIISKPLNAYIILYAKLIAPVFTTVSVLLLKKACTSFVKTSASITQLVVFYLFSIISVVPSISHLVSFARLLRIQFCNNVSLNESDEEIWNNSLKTWRWYMLSRDPRRLAETLRVWRLKWKRFAFGDGPDDSPIILNRQKRKEVSFNGQVDPAKAKNIILRLESNYNVRNPNAPLADRSRWISEGSFISGDKLEDQYEQKTFDDPLGIAVKKTLGIGMSLGYDHDTNLEEGENPDIHRLRARAAKSAIRRSRDLFNPKIAKEILDNIQDPHERANKARELRESAVDENNFMANALMRMIPGSAGVPKGLQYEGLKFVRESNTSIRAPEFDEMEKGTDDVSDSSTYEIDIEEFTYNKEGSSKTLNALRSFIGSSKHEEENENEQLFV